jgi:hypothetical protein
MSRDENCSWSKDEPFWLGEEAGAKDYPRPDRARQFFVRASPDISPYGGRLPKAAVLDFSSKGHILNVFPCRVGARLMEGRLLFKPPAAQ